MGSVVDASGNLLLSGIQIVSSGMTAVSTKVDEAAGGNLGQVSHQVSKRVQHAAGQVVRGVSNTLDLSTNDDDDDDDSTPLMGKAVPVIHTVLAAPLPADLHWEALRPDDARKSTIKKSLAFGVYIALLIFYVGAAVAPRRPASPRATSPASPHIHAAAR